MSRRTAHALTISSLETLEDRLVLSATPAANAWESIVDSVGGPKLGEIYTEYFNYVQSGSQGAYYTPLARTIEMIGPTVGVELQFNSGTAASNAALMEGAGLVETATIPAANIVEGFMPIGQLPAIAAVPNLASMTPVAKPSNYILPGSSASAAATTTTANSEAAVVANRGGTALGSLYQEYLNYEAAGGTGAFSPVESGRIVISGTSVGVDIRTSAANFAAVLGAMKVYGMQVTATAPQVGVIEGVLPIAQLPTVVTNADVLGVSPVYKPNLR